MKSTSIVQLKDMAALAPPGGKRYHVCASPLNLPSFFSNGILLTACPGLDPGCLQVLAAGSTPSISPSSPIPEAATSTPTTPLWVALSRRLHYCHREAKELRDDWYLSCSGTYGICPVGANGEANPGDYSS